MSELSSNHISGAASAHNDYWRAVAGQVVRDRLIYAIILLYAAGAGVLALSLGQTDKLVYLDYAPVWLRGVVTAVLIYLGVTELPASIMADPKNPLARLRSRRDELLNPRVVAGGLLILGLILLNGAFTSVKNMLPDLVAFTWDRSLADLDATLHFGKDPWLWLQPLLGHHVVTRAIQYSYTGGWMIALCALTSLMAVSRQLDGLRLRFFATYAFCWIVLGNVVAGAFMSAGPVYFGEVTGDAARFADQLRYLSFSDGLPHSSYELQRSLWQLHLADRTELGTGVSAFPSLHVAMATLFALTGWSINRWSGWIATGFLAVILLGSVHLAWHYAVDGYVSMLATTAVWYGVGALQSRFKVAS